MKYRKLFIRLATKHQADFTGGYPNHPKSDFVSIWRGDAYQISTWFKSMRNKKAYAADKRSPDIQRIGKHFSPFIKGTFYQKILTGNLHIRFAYGYYSFSKPYPLNFHKELEILYFRQGRGSYYIAGKIYPFQKRLLLITKPNEIHTMTSVPLKEYPELAYLVFPLGWLGMDLNVKSWPHEVLLSEEEAARLDLIIWQVSDEVKNQGSGYEDMVRAKFQEICCLVRRIVSHPKKERAHPLVDQLREYIIRHSAEKTSVLNISKGFGYTGRYLEGLFKKSMGSSLKRYILQRRVIEARILLETQPELKLTAIATQVGFEDYQLFHRIFKILIGVKPESYRHVIQQAVAKKDKAG